MKPPVKNDSPQLLKLTVVMAMLMLIILGCGCVYIYHLQKISIACWEKTFPGFVPGATRLDIPFSPEVETNHARCMGYAVNDYRYRLARLVNSNTQHDGTLPLPKSWIPPASQ